MVGGAAVARGIKGQPEGVGRLHAYSAEAMGTDSPHFSVETVGAERLHTEQVIVDSQLRNTTVVAAEGLPHPTKTIEFPLKDVEAAQALQRSRIGAELGRYHVARNSCLSQACDVLRAGGVQLPEGVELIRWARQMFGVE